MKMKELLLFLSYVLWGSADALHTDIHVVGCSYIHGGVMFGLNREELWYADFEKQMDVYPQPPFVQPISFGDEAYKIAVANLYGCRQFLQLSETAMKDFPPRRVSWTKNGQITTGGSSIKNPYPNKNGTFTQIARLQFIPKQGDVYSCTVEHLGLTKPLIKIYNVDTPETPEKHKPSLGPAVFCGLGVIIGVLCAAGGTFFILKANKCI
ncbi:SLA class II histocompatibility antigen, DQ haplotype D alpha chain isoform X2 [Maylandia zebra]|uniref:SLA class II histocompatibility antigen, DQ haplotype D alpha chain isoform X2 n=1 Tax=Maylandia zebra TaxID=106582 RepID=UPI00403CCBDA